MLKVETKQAPPELEEVLEQNQGLQAKPPDFINYQLDFKSLQAQLKPFEKLKKLIVIGNGGSINSFQAFKKALSNKELKPSFILSTPEPDLIHYLRANFSSRETLVMPISKSGNTLETTESLLAFKEYQVVTVTNPEEGLLSQLAKLNEWPIIPHPEITGRFSSFTESGIAPAAFVGIKGEKIIEGSQIIYQQAKLGRSPQNNSALTFASFLKSLEKVGRPEIFFPIYSYFLEGFSAFILQIFHETTGKEGKGPTCLPSLAPEWQHHTAQRFFGGRESVGGVFITVNQPQKDLKVSVKKEFRELSLSSIKLKDLNQLSLQNSLMFEAEANMERAVEKKIPIAHIEIDRVCEETVGELTGLFHLSAYYLALLLGVNPLIQPAVEAAKISTFQKISRRKS